MNDSSYQVRRDAIIILVKERSPEAVKALEKALNDDDFEVRFYAKQGLKQMI